MQKRRRKFNVRKDECRKDGKKDRERKNEKKEGGNLIKEGLTVTITYRYVDTLERKREIECKKGRIYY